MKKIVFFFFTILLFLAKPKTIFAQGTFTCVCSGNPFLTESFSCLVQASSCQEGYTPNVNLCYTNAQQNPLCGSIPCQVDCISSSTVQDIAWGGNCDPSNPNQRCSQEGTSCRSDFTNTYRCLYPTKSIPYGTNQECRDSTECLDYDGQGITRCGVPLGQSTSICQTIYQGARCTNSGICRSSCTTTEHAINAIDCVNPNPVCCAPNNNALCTTSGSSGTNGIYTAIGCIPIDAISSFTAKILGFAIGISGGIAFLLIIFAGFQIITSQGDRYKLKSGRDLLTAAISALLLVIFSTFLLRVIGIDILGIITQSTPPF
jgi:hypothetical protein